MRIFLAIFCIFAHAAAFAQYQATVDSTGALQFPTADEFKEANSIASLGGVAFNIDTTPTLDMESPTVYKSRSFSNPFYYKEGSTTKRTLNASGGTMATFSLSLPTPNFVYWTDGEVKAFVKINGIKVLVYWYSTQWGAQMGADFTSHPAADLNARVFYTCPEYEHYRAGAGREWIEYVHNDSNARTIYEHAQNVLGISNPTIGGIVIVPNFSGTTVGGTPIKDIFTGKCECVFLKCSPTGIEKSQAGFSVWRTIIPTTIQGGF